VIRCSFHLSIYLSKGLLSHPPVAVSEFVGHVARLKLDDAIRFAAEYESIDPGGGAPGPIALASNGTLVAAVDVLPGAATAPPLTWEASVAEVNRAKNRYANVVAYDHSRVHLHSSGGTADGSDYINANFIDGFRRPNAYIATQVSVKPIPVT
jgi:netrin-G3 ligand